jgi:hypothetical protein
MRVAMVLLIVASAAGLGGQATTRPDFSGTWTLDNKASTAGPLGVAAMLGSRFTAKQDAKTLTLDISSPVGPVHAVYNLDGTPSKIVMPGEPAETIVSLATWEADRLIITTKSDEILDGKTVEMVTRRVISIGPDGSLTLERSGTPASLVPTTKSVYRRARETGNDR